MNSSKVILVAEDDVMVRDLISKVLNNEGYEVLAAADGKEALALSRAYQGSIGLLLTDLSMPHMDGLTAYRTISLDRAAIKVLFISGDIERLGKLPAGLPFLRKPFVTMDGFRIKVQEVLAGGNPKTSFASDRSVAGNPGIY